MSCNKLLSFSIFLVSLCFLSGLLPSQIHAATVKEGDIGAYPTHYDPSNLKTRSWFIYELKPGEHKDDSITVVNNTEGTLSVKVYAVDATTTSDGGFALLNEDQQQTDIGSWVKMSTNLITLGPKDRKEVPFSIAIPRNVIVGDHGGGIIIQEVKKVAEFSQGMGLNIISRIGTRIYETVPGAKVFSLSLSDLKYKLTDKNILFTFTMENKGNVFLSPTGFLEIKDMFGKVIDRVPLQGLGTVFPGKPTTVTVKSGIATPLFGSFTASIIVNYSPTQSANISTSFYTLSWMVGAPLPLLLILLALYFIIRKLTFRHKRKVIQTQTTQIVATVRPLAPKMPIRADSQPGISEKDVDAIFIAHHIKLLIIFILISVIVLSSLFAFGLQFFVLSKMGQPLMVAASQSSQPTNPPQQQPTEIPTPTPVPVAKTSMNIIVLNGTGKAGLAKTVAQKLTAAGYTVTKTGNAPDTTQTTIQYPAGKIDGANQLIEALKPDFPDAQPTASDSPDFTVNLGTSN